MVKTDNSKQYEVILYRIIFLICWIITPIVTYLWKNQNVNFQSNVYIGWIMSTIFLFCFIFSFINKWFKKNLIYIIDVMFFIATFSAIYFSYVNKFNIEYTALLILTIFSVSVIFNKPILLLIYYITNLILVFLGLYFSGETYIKKDTLVIIFLLFFTISNLNAWVKYVKQKRLRLSEEKHRLLITQMQQGLAVHEVVCDDNGKVIDYRFLSMNESFERLTGLQAEQIMGKTVLEVLPETESYWIEKYGHVAMTGKPIQYENYSKELGRYFETVAYSPRPKQFAVIVSDITERKNTENLLRASEEKYRLLTEFASDVIWILNLKLQKFTYISPSIFQLRGLTAEEAMKESLEESLTPESLKIVKAAIEKNMKEFLANPQSSNYYINEFQQPCKNGDIIWVEVSTKFRHNADGEIEIVGVSRNIEERKNAQKEVVYLSYHDQLTGLYNRRYFEDAIKRLDDEKHIPLTLVMIDVNGLKLTNDAFGHKAGDMLLEKVGNILKKECRKNDVVARIGGDEFVLLLPQTDVKNAEKVIERINATIANEKNHNVILSISIGFAVKKQMDDDMDEVYKKAEDEMYKHKLSESSSMRSKTIDLIMNTLYEKNNREMLHSKRVSEICEAIASKMDFDKDDINQIRIAGLMHDIGKIGIDDKILDKPRKLNNDEWNEIERHSEIGYRILSSVNEFSEIANFVLEHHERWDGKGYPRGLKGEEISLQARIIAIADTFDAMTSDRTYRKALSEEDAINEIRTHSGTQFDAFVAQVFIQKVLGKE